jgi:diazepam-binding inhibitor (GABA receptor modulator, acyl-CoA-binding protein)
MERPIPDLKTRFETAAQQAQQLKKRPDNANLLMLYALFKQSTEGDVSGKRPGILDIVGRAKYDSWTAVKGTSQEDAMESYIALVERLKR